MKVAQRGPFSLGRRAWMRLSRDPAGVGDEELVDEEGRMDVFERFLLV